MDLVGVLAHRLGDVCGRRRGEHDVQRGALEEGGGEADVAISEDAVAQRADTWEV